MPKEDPEDKIVEEKDPKDQNNKPDVDDDGLSEEEQKSARSLYKALKDPETAQELIETLAKRAGILDKKGEPREDKKATEKKLGKITNALTKKLGKDFEKFSEMVGPALDEAIDEIIEERFGNVEANSTSDKWEESVDKFLENHETTSKVEKKMLEIIERNPPNLSRKGFKASEYLEDMWELAHRKLGISVPAEKEERRRGLRDIPDITEKTVDKNISIDDAIDLAMKGIRIRRK